MSSYLNWCIGWKRPAHFPDGGAHIVIDADRDVRLCRDCHRQWAAEPPEGVDW